MTISAVSSEGSIPANSSSFFKIPATLMKVAKLATLLFLSLSALPTAGASIDCADLSHRMHIEEAQNTLLRCEEAREHFQTVPPFTIQCVPESEAMGKSLAQESKILMATQDESEIWTSIVMGVSSMKRMGALKAIQNCGTDAKTYATEVERINYQAFQEAHQILNACKEKRILYTHDFVSLLSGKKKYADFSTFEGYLRAQKHTGHTQIYEADHRRVCDS